MLKTVAFDEQEIVRLLSEGHEPSFRAIYDRYWTKVFRVADRYLQSDDLAQDIVQDVFCALWDRRTEFSNIRNIEAYLFTMAQHQTYKAMRKWAYELRKNEEYVLNIVQEAEDSDVLALSNQYEDLLNKAIHLLPPKQREVFQLIREEGLSHQDVANKLNLSEAAVKKNMVRALHFIRGFLAPHLVPVFLLFFDFLGLY